MGGVTWRFSESYKTNGGNNSTELLYLYAHGVQVKYEHQRLLLLMASGWNQIHSFFCEKWCCNGVQEGDYPVPKSVGFRLMKGHVPPSGPSPIGTYHHHGIRSHDPYPH
eukprot:Gb_13016 [translate_table: standard]